jgi:hypothetical protein
MIMLISLKRANSFGKYFRADVALVDIMGTQNSNNLSSTPALILKIDLQRPFPINVNQLYRKDTYSFDREGVFQMIVYSFQEVSLFHTSRLPGPLRLRAIADPDLMLGIRDNYLNLCF